MEMYNEQFLNDTMKKMADWQTQAYEPMRKMSESAASAYEKYAKLSYAAAGDVVDFCVDQAHMIASTSDMKAYYENQQSAYSQFNSTMSTRAGEFVDLASDLTTEAKEAVSNTMKQAATSSTPAKKTPAKAAAK